MINVKQNNIIVDYARKPARKQAEHLSLFWVLIRRLCYILAQKGNPDIL